MRGAVRIALYAFAIAVIGACVLGGLGLVAIGIWGWAEAAIAGDPAAIIFGAIALAFIALIVAANMDE